MKSRLFYFVFFLLSFFLLLPGCEKTTSPVTSTPVSLTAEYVGVTETGLRLRIENIELPTGFQLIRDDSLVGEGQLKTGDTLLTDTLLWPAHSYAYQAILLRDMKRIAQSEVIRITTMDTTSHDFQWETFEIPSPFGSGMLYDVAVINENDIWAVGAIYSDSAQPWLPYNAVHWDGIGWELKRINFYLCPNGTSPTPYPIQAIFAFSEDDIWFTRGASFVHWNGNQFVHDCSMNSIIDGSIQKIWGINSQAL